MTEETEDSTEQEVTTPGMALPAGYKLTRSAFEELRHIIYECSGISLKEPKRQMVQSRLTKRLRHLKIASFDEYITYLFECPDELTNMVNRITTNKTSFFREPQHFRFLQDNLLPNLLAQQQVGSGHSINGWCAASSTGEEPYSIAMVLAQFFRKHPSWQVRLLASDLDTNVLDAARTGIYPHLALGDIQNAMIKAYTENAPEGEEDTFGFTDEIKRHLIFRQINLMDARYPIRTPLDFIFCRNVFIYFTRFDRDAIVERFIKVLKPGGVLFLGHSEVLDMESFGDRLRFVGNTTYQKVGK